MEDTPHRQDGERRQRGPKRGAPPQRRPERAFYPYYVRRAAALGISAVDDQMLGAGLMWSGGHMYLLPILLILWGLARDAIHERDDAQA